MMILCILDVIFYFYFYFSQILKIIDLGSRGTCAYLILRGCVRIFSGASKEGEKLK